MEVRAARTPFRPLSVLVVEDEPLIRLTLVDVLRRDGLVVFEASDVDEAIALLDDNRIFIDLVFTDVRLPGGRDGFDLAKWIRERRPELLIVVTSGQVAASTVNRELREGEHFIEKPYIMGELADRFRAFREQALTNRNDASPGRRNVQPESNPQRSPNSRAFERLWRSLPREGLIPPRAAFDPARAKEFLHSLILVEAPSEDRPRLQFRLAGDVINEKVQRNVASINYLDFLPPEQHAESLAAARLINEHPCGTWQLSPIMYERGFTQLVEVTIFPLGSGSDGIPLMLGYLDFLPGKVTAVPLYDRAIAAETSKVYEFIDIGAGVPTLIV
jgi:CheY-like chemotaxis protein